eukprot:s1463_g5.t1
MCHRLRQDILTFLNNKKLLNIASWPKNLIWFVAEHFYECIRCQLGRYCPEGIEHTMIPGKCRHGRYAPGTNPKSKSSSQPADPVQAWKNNADRDVLDVVEIKNVSGIDLSVKKSHYIKKMLMETIQTSLGCGRDQECLRHRPECEEESLHQEDADGNDPDQSWSHQRSGQQKD